MKFQRIQFPAKTLIVSSLDKSCNVFILYFLKLWLDKFREKPDLAQAASDDQSRLASAFSHAVTAPTSFFVSLKFLLVQKYRTVIFLNPDVKANRPLKWAARILFVNRRAGFAPLKGIHPFNYSLPFNKENHHFVHQLKIFFEYLTGEKVLEWHKPEIPAALTAAIAIPAENYAVLAIDIMNPVTERLLGQLQKFINLAARNLHLVLIIGKSGKAGAETEKTPQDYARRLSETMTEHAVKVTELVMHPTEQKKIALVREAVWVTGTDAEILNFAALQGVPSLSLFGPLNERVWQPFATRARVLAGDFDCRPCTEFPGKVICKNRQEWLCMSGVTGELMAATLTGMLQRKGPAARMPSMAAAGSKPPVSEET